MPAPPPWWVRHKRALAAAAAAQACAFLNAVTAVSSESISLQGVDVSTFQARRFPLSILARPAWLTRPPQSFLNYGLLALVYGGLRVRAARRAGGSPFALSVPLQHYALLAAVDVEANFLIVKAYQFTNITSVTLLDSARRAARSSRAGCSCAARVESPR